MYNSEDILARIKAGETPEDIAKSFTDALNGAIEAQKEEEAKKAEEEAQEKKKKEAKKKEAKLFDANEIADLLNHFYKEYCDATSKDVVTGADIVHVFDSAANLVATFDKLENGFKMTLSSPRDTKTDSYIDKVFDNFFKLF